MPVDLRYWFTRKRAGGPGRSASREVRDRRDGRTPPQVESLEGRTVLSGGALGAHLAALHNHIAAQVAAPVPGDWAGVFSQTGLPVISGAQGFTVKAPSGLWFQHPIGAFHVSSAAGASDPSSLYFRALVSWGDGTETAGFVTGEGSGNYFVSGQHRYNHSGTYTTTIQVITYAPGNLLATTQGTIQAG